MQTLLLKGSTSCQASSICLLCTIYCLNPLESSHNDLDKTTKKTAMSLSSWSARGWARGEISMNYTPKYPSIIDNSIVRCIILSQIRALQLGIHRSSLQQLYASVGS